MKKLSLLLLSFACLFFYSCKPKNDNYGTVKVEIKNLPEKIIYLQELGLNNEIKTIDSVKTKANAAFELKFPRSEQAQMMRIDFGGKYIYLTNDASPISVKADWDSISIYTTSGSPGTASLNQLLSRIYKFEEKIGGLHIAIDSLTKRPNNDSTINAAQSELAQQQTALKQFVRAYADTTQSLPVAILAALRDQDLFTDKAYLTQLTASMQKRFGEQQLLQDFKKLNPQADKPDGKVAIGKPAPNFTLSTVDGKKVSLSDYRGKYVLLDFWASWCGPCRKENPNVLAAYNSFKNKNFDILGVSLDDNKEKWQLAIALDSLLWTQASDLQGWNSSLVNLYGIESIPANFLIDTSGVIIDKNLRGAELSKRLSEILK